MIRNNFWDYLAKFWEIIRNKILISIRMYFRLSNNRRATFIYNFNFFPSLSMLLLDRLRLFDFKDWLQYFSIEFFFEKKNVYSIVLSKNLWKVHNMPNNMFYWFINFLKNSQDYIPLFNRLRLLISRKNPKDCLHIW